MKKIRNWFFEKFDKYTKQIKDEYYEFMHENSFQLYFFNWFEEYFLKPKEINVINQCFK